jgi:hypothetical protein
MTTASAPTPFQPRAAARKSFCATVRGGFQRKKRLFFLASGSAILAQWPDFAKTSPGAKGVARSKRRRGSKRDKLDVTQDIVLKVSAPPGSRFLGYEDIIVQDLRIKVETVRYRKERWSGPSGERIIATLPSGILGGYGPELRRFIAAGHFQGQITTERLTALLTGMGLDISKRQVVRLLSQGLEDLIEEDEEVLRTGLETAYWITVDDTGARHAGKDGYVTHIGDDRFAVFRSGSSKSRKTFLSNLRAGRNDYVINAEALAYMAERSLAGPFIALLKDHSLKYFADEAEWGAHLKALGLADLEVSPDPVTIATEGALWGALKDHGLLGDTVIVSDGAGQFRLDNHAACWVHAERLVYKLNPTNKAHLKAVELARTLIWWLYRDLKRYKLDPTSKRARALRVRFDRIFTKKTGFVLLDRQLRRLHARKADLLRVLERPERIRKRHPFLGHQTGNLRGHGQRSRQGRQGHHAWTSEDLPKTRRLVLPLSRRPFRRLGCATSGSVARSHPARSRLTGTAICPGYPIRQFAPPSVSVCDCRKGRGLIGNSMG